MYTKILIPVDNSEDSTAAVKFAVELASDIKESPTLSALHVYAARLHNERFMEMEATLPERFQDEALLKEQRKKHDTLITDGLRLISDSYMNGFIELCEGKTVKHNALHREGKNYTEIISEMKEGGYDLTIMGALGLGRVESSRIGGVTERVVRRATSDLLITRAAAQDNGNLLVCVDGSPASFDALRKAVAFARILKAPIEIVSAFDPDYHRVAFKSISTVLTSKDESIFNFKEQESLHDEIIDKNLAALYQGHLDRAEEYAKAEGITVTSTLLSGKPFDEILRFAEQTLPKIIFMGRTGVHATDDLDIGTNTENVLRETTTNLYLASGSFALPAKKTTDKLNWTTEGEEMLKRIPIFARAMAKKMIEETAKREGLTEVTAEFMQRVRKDSGM